ncbi:MAG: LysR family transcriptional regulator [bacterium]|nr:LysR family transcriptional regulator [bacterium]
MGTVSLRQLDIFAQMVVAGSLASCAQDLGIAVEDVARAVASLEMRLGYRLFDYEGGKARLTEAGHRTAQAMTLLSQDRQENWDGVAAPASAPATVSAQSPTPTFPTSSSTAETDAVDPSIHRSILLAAPAPIFGHFQEALAAFESANEDITITLDLTVHSAQDAAFVLTHRQVDIAYFYALGEPVDMVSRYGWSEQVNIYTGSQHPLAQAPSVSHADLAHIPMLTMEPGNAIRRIVDEALEHGRLPMRRPALETDNMFDIMTALRDGVGYFAAFGAMARDLGRMTGISRLALDAPLPAIEVRQAVSPRAATTPAVEALADFLFL